MKKYLKKLVVYKYREPDRYPAPFFLLKTPLNPLKNLLLILIIFHLAGCIDRVKIICFIIEYLWNLVNGGIYKAIGNC